MNLQNYGLRIKNKRKEYKLTQNELAIKVGVSRSYISDIENGRLI
ncbi:helix-turn-helix domain-containing protein, partial [Staphylococcus epidermidis]